MKTTLDISDTLLSEIKEIAKAEGVTLRSLVEEGLHQVLKDHSSPRKYDYKPVSFDLGGFTKDFQDANWSQIRDEIYKGHGT
jgi:thiamine monophosphate kinase